MATSLLPPGFDQPEAPVPPVPRVRNGAAPPAADPAAQPDGPVPEAVADGHARPAGHLLRYAPDMSLRDLAARTRLPQDELAALDRGDTSRCGGDFYLRAHLTCIAAALHVEPDTLLLSFDRRPPARLPDGTLGLRAPVRHRRRAHGKRLLFALAIVVLLGAVAVGGYTFANRTTTPSAGKHPASTHAVAPATHAAQRKAAPRKAVLPPPAIPAGTVAVALSVNAPTWMLAQDQNGATLFEGTVPAGGTQFLHGTSVHAVIGNAGAVTPTCNYHRGAVLGAPGQVVTMTFAPGINGC